VKLGKRHGGGFVDAVSRVVALEDDGKVLRRGGLRA
jgi:hypothetical protein